jgi:hypothetical protein
LTDPTNWKLPSTASPASSRPACLSAEPMS